MTKKYLVKQNCYCEGYLHEITNYPRKGLEVKLLNKGDIVELDKKWNNFYGSYIRVIKNNVMYDIKPEYLEEIED